MDVSLLYFEDCPNWKVADERLTALAAERPDVRVTRHDDLIRGHEAEAALDAHRPPPAPRSFR